MFKRYLSFPIFFNEPGDPGPGGGPPAGAPPPAATPPAAPPAGGPPAAGAAPGAGAPPPGAPNRPAFSYAEDRSQWVPPYRLQEQNQRFQQLQRENQQINQRVRALMGVAEPPNPKHVELRTAITEIMPELAPLLSKPELLAKVLQLAETGQFDQMSNSESAGWRRHAFSMTQQAVESYATAVGLTVDKLPANATNKLAGALQDFIGADRTGERDRRYQMGDPTLIKECIEDLTGFWVAPVRAAQQQQGQRLVDQNRRLPSQGPRGAVPPAGPPARRDRATVREAARQYMASGGEG